jgi:hypothetical protein
VQHGTLLVVGGLLVAFLVLPLLALVVSTSPMELQEGLRHPLVWPALRLSLLTTTISLALVVLLGTPLAWSLARTQGRLARAVETAVQLPIVIPPAVAGVAMLLAFGRRGPAGRLAVSRGLGRHIHHRGRGHGRGLRLGAVLRAGRHQRVPPRGSEAGPRGAHLRRVSAACLLSRGHSPSPHRGWWQAPP